MQKIWQILSLSSLILGVISSVATASPLTQLQRLSNTNSDEIETSGQTTFTQGFKFRLQDCQRIDRIVVCQLSITNRRSSKNIGIYGNYGQYSSRAIDFDGNQYIAKSVQLGDHQRITSVGRRILRRRTLQARIIFELPKKVNEIAFLEISSNQGSARFIDVDITNKERY